MANQVDSLEVKVEANAKAANSQLDKLISNMNRLKGSFDGINSSKTLTSGATKSSTALKSLSSRLGGLSDSLTKAKTKVRSLAATFGYFYASCFLIIRGLKSLGNSIKSAVDYIEEYNYFNVVVGKMADEWSKDFEQYGYDNAEAYGNSFRDRMTSLIGDMSGFKIEDDGTLSSIDSKNLGLDVTKLTNYSAGLMQVTNSLGLTGEAGINTSMALTKLAGDMSSMRNVDLSTVMTNLQSGLIGQSRALYKYGIDITNATLQTYAYKYGITKAVSEMTQAEKMQLRMIAIMEQSDVYAGDLANTINSVANQYRMFKNNIAALARTIGGLFVPIIQKVLPYINAFVIAIQKLFGWIGSIFGIKQGLADVIGGSGTGYSDALDGLSDDEDSGLGTVSDDADNASDAIDRATDSAKEFKNELMGFDEINKLSDNTTDSFSPKSGGSSVGKTKGIGGGGIDMTDSVLAAMDAYNKRWQDALDKMDNKAQDISDDIVSYFQRMWKSIEPFRTSVKNLWNEGLSKFGTFTWTALKDFYNEFLVPIGTWAFATKGSGITRLVDVCNELLNEIDWNRLNESLKNFWIAIEPYAEQFGEGLIDFFKGLGEVAVDTINAFPGLLDKITSALNNGDPKKARAWGKAFGELALGVVALKGIGKAIGGIASVGSNIASISDGLSALFGSTGIFSAIGGSLSSLGAAIAPVLPIIAVIAAVVAGLAHAYNTNEDVRKSVSDSISTIKSGLQPVLDFLSQTVIPNAQTAFSTLLSDLKPLFDFVSGMFTSAWIDILCPALNYLGNTVLPILTDTFENLWNNVLVPVAKTLETILKPAVEIVSKVLTVLWKNVIVPFADFTISVFGKQFELLASIFNNIVVPAVSQMSNVILWIWNNVLSPIANYMSTVFGPVFEAVCTNIGNIVGDLKNIFGGLIDFISHVFAGDWSGAWNGIVEAFSGIFGLIADIAKSPINMVIGCINAMINGVEYGINACISGINRLSFDVPDWVPGIGGDHMGFDLGTVSFGNIDYLANGGFEDVGQVFVANEAGPEMVGNLGGKSAVANQKEITSALTQAIYPAIYNGVVSAMSKNGGLSANVTIQGDTSKIFTVVQDEANSYTSRTGMSPFPV